MKGEMVPEFHKHYGSAALVLLNDLHENVAEKKVYVTRLRGRRAAGVTAVSSTRAPSRS